MATAIGTYAARAAVEGRIGGTFSAGDDSTIDAICNQVNMTIERETGRIMAPITSAQYVYDGDGTRRLYLPITASGTPIGGIRAISVVEMAQYTGAAYETVDSSQVFLRGQSNPAAPYDVLLFTDYPTGSFTAFPAGFATVRLTATAGWAAMPDDIIELATAAAVNIWNFRQRGSGDEGIGEPGWLARFLSPRDVGTLRAYTLADSLA